MSKFVILGDSTCDLSEEFCEKYDIGIVEGHIVLPGKGEIAAFRKWEGITCDEFYKGLKSEPDKYTTSPPNVTEFENVFEKYAAEGTDVLVITISAAISGTYDFAVTAKDNVASKYPGAKIRCIDSRRFGPGCGLMAVHASLLRDEGKSMEEVADILEERKNTFHQAGWLDDLSFVAKKGRMTHGKAFLGTLVGIKPIGEFDYNGLTTVIGKAKGAKAAYAALITYIEKTVIDPGEQIFFIAQSNRYDQAVKYKEMIEEKFHPKAVYINDVFPMCGINVGPGLMAAYYTGKPISKDLSEERKIIEEAIGG